MKQRALGAQFECGSLVLGPAIIVPSATMWKR